MTFRVTDTSSSARFAAQINTGRQRSLAAQERISTNKRINRPSDDPSGAGAIIRLRTSQAAIEQFRRNAGTSNDTLLVADGVLDSYEQTLDQARVLLTQAASDITSGSSRALIADQVDGAHQRVLNMANARSGETYLFGGTRQNVPPFDAAAVPAAGATSRQLLQLEPGAVPVAVGVTAETVFSDASGSILDTLASAATALRGTGDPVQDRATINAALTRLDAFANQAKVARVRVGGGLNATDTAVERLDRDFLSFAATAERIEGADFVEAALQFQEAERALEATLQVGAQRNRNSLISLLG